MDFEWKKKVNKQFAITQILDIVETFLNSDQFNIEPKSFYDDEVRKKIVIMMGMESIVRKIFSAITHQNSNELIPIYKNPRYRSTKDALEWRTKKRAQVFKKTHMNLCVVDSAWEAAHARELDRDSHVEAWVKNDHLGFEIPYVHNGSLRNYIPDFIVKISEKAHLILEVKGVKKVQDESKWDYMRTWVKAVGQDEENGDWHFAVSQDETGQEVHNIIKGIIQMLETFEVVTRTLSAIDKARKSAEIFKNSKHKMQVADLISALADAKMTIVSLQQEINNLNEKIKIKDKIIWVSPYYFIEKEDGKDGPYCQKCFDSDNKLIRLYEIITRNWKCKDCNNSYLDKNYTPPQPHKLKY